jgi:DnaJ-class molecular chaperone
MPSAPDFVDYYHLLGLAVDKDPSAVSLKHINNAYKKLALKWHPDKSPEDPEAPARFATLQRCIETLREATSRAAYDERYRGRKREEQRNAELDATARAMKLDLAHRERESANKAGEKQAQLNRERVLQSLRRETEGRVAEPARPAQAAKRVLSYDEHVARERRVLAKLLASGS